MLLKNSLSRTFKKVTASILIFTFMFLTSVPSAYAGGFEDAVRQGRSLGTDLIDSYSPQNINRILQDRGLGTIDAITPRVEEAQKQRGSYEGFYTDPGGMSGAAIDTDVGTFLRESYLKRQKFDLRQDPVFGSRCMEKDPEGRCIMWSMSQDVMANAYTDCERVMVLEYDDPPTKATCVGTGTIQTVQCITRAHVVVETETIYTKCSVTNPQHRPGQIYAVCRDYYERYKVYDHTGRVRDDCRCANHPGAFCDTPPYYIIGAPPSGATYLGMSYENYRDRDKKDGWDLCTSDRYKWYAKHKHSIIERVFLRYDSPCGDNVDRWIAGCSVSRLEQCDPSGIHCVISIKDGKDTGQRPDPTPLVRVSQGTKTTEHSGCPAGVCPAGCVAGTCPPGAVLRSAPMSPSVLTGIRRANVTYECVFSDPHCSPEYEHYCPTTGLCSYETFHYYTNSLTCGNFVGSLENYLMCLKYHTVEFDNSSGLGQLSSSPVRADSAVSEYRSSITWFRIYGGPAVKPHLNNWLSRVTFNCSEAADGCQHLRDQGCVHYSQRCLDNACKQIEHTYRCGGTGRVKGYKIAHNCAGDIRCMGSDCVEVSYEANQDFAAATTATEVLHHARTDGTEADIFSGREFECQSEFIDCCKPNTGGVSIADYVKAAYAGSFVYTTLSTGIGATATATAASITTTVNSVASILGVVPTVTTTAAGGAVTTVATSTIAGTTVTTSTTVAAGTAAGETVVAFTGAVPSSTVTAVATIATVAAVIIAAYAVGSLLLELAYGCDEKDLETSTRMGFRLCHYIGEKCTVRVLGVCLQRKEVHCCFNSILARVIHEQGRPQIGRGWGNAHDPDCRGFTPGELNAIDFSKIDLREYMQYIEYKTEVSPEEAQRIADEIKQKYN